MAVKGVEGAGKSSGPQASQEERTRPMNLRRAHSGKNGHRARVGIEALESRELLAFTDVAQVVAQYPRHPGPTVLDLNFDGGTLPADPNNNFLGLGSRVTIRPFETEPGDAGLNRDRDIQDVLYQVSEVFAPFDVEVERIYGAGNFDRSNGNTTIFIGGNSVNSTLQVNTSGSGPRFNFTKYFYASTPPGSVDTPGFFHAPNSNGSDVAFVDPVVGSYVGNDSIALAAAARTQRVSSNTSPVNIGLVRQAIVHEAGHTFGLSHVRSDGSFDPAPLGYGAVNDVMSYDASNQFFANQSLALTTWNNTGTSTTLSGSLPGYIDWSSFFPIPRVLSTQNSFQSLGSALGLRGLLAYATIADISTVTPGYRNGVMTDLTDATSASGTLARPGDYRVFSIQITPFSLFTTRIVVHPVVSPGLPSLGPELLLYDARGTRLIAAGGPQADGTAALTLSAVGTYKLVLGAHDDRSSGGYTVSIERIPVWRFLVGGAAPVPMGLGAMPGSEDSGRSAFADGPVARVPRAAGSKPETPLLAQSGGPLQPVRAKARPLQVTATPNRFEDRLADEVLAAWG
jgi:hypothetical protein